MNAGPAGLAGPGAAPAIRLSGLVAGVPGAARAVGDLRPAPVWRRGGPNAEGGALDEVRVGRGDEGEELSGPRPRRPAQGRSPGDTARRVSPAAPRVVLRCPAASPPARQNSLPAHDDSGPPGRRHRRHGNGIPAIGADPRKA